MASRVGSEDDLGVRHHASQTSQDTKSQCASPESHGTSRVRPNPMAHEGMLEQLTEWQQQNGKADYERPTDKEWNMDARVECIKAGHITKYSCPDVVRSHLHAAAQQNSSTTAKQHINTTAQQHNRCTTAHQHSST